MTSISAESCVRAFLSTWVWRFGLPAVLTSDRGAQFTSSVWSGVCSSLGILASTTTFFHPQSNGMIMLFHHSLKSALRSHLSGSDWFLHLPLVLLGLRMVPKDDSRLSVSKAVYGSPLTIPGEFLGSPELPLSVFSGKAVSPALPPARERPALRAPGPIIRPPVVLDPPSASLPVCPARRVCFQLPPSVPACQNPFRAVGDRRICSAISPLLLLGGVLWWVDVCQSVPTADPALSTDS